MPVNPLVEINKHFAMLNEMLRSDGLDQAVVLKQWRNNGVYPYEIISSQLDFLKYYFENYLEKRKSPTISNDPAFLNLLHELISEFEHCNRDDVRFFYSQNIAMGQQTVLEFFQRLTQTNSEDIRAEMEAFAIFLSKFDPSLILDCQMLKPVYEANFVGPGFTLSRFRESILPLLMRKSSSNIKPHLESYQKQIESQQTFTKENVSQLMSIFSLRWNEIAGTPEDYTRDQDGVNWIWILAARLLVGAKIIPDNLDVYNVLMPTIKRTHVGLDRLSIIPLSNLILSEDGTDLISLDASVAVYQQARDQKQQTRDQKTQKRFHNCNVYPHLKFTPLEVERISYAAKRFRRYVNIIHNDSTIGQGLPLKRSSVHMFYSLLNASIREGITPERLSDLYSSFGDKLSQLSGDCQARVMDTSPVDSDKLAVLSLREVLFIRAEHDVKIGFCNKDGEYEQQSVSNINLIRLLKPYEHGKYVVLTAHKDQLNEYLVQVGSRTRINEEMYRIYEHRVEFGGYDNSIRYILEEIARGEDSLAACISEWSDFLLQLVVDYFPDINELRFSGEVESNIVQKNKMRENSTKRVCSDLLCAQGEPIERNLILMASLLSYRFPSDPQLLCHTMSMWDLENTTNDLVVKEIFDQLMLGLEDDDQDDELIPVDVMNTFVQPLILQGRLTSVSGATQRWLDMIQSEDFFTDKCAFYDPKHLFLALESFGKSMNPILDDILSTLLQTEMSKSMQLVRVNVKFKLFFNTLADTTKADVLKKLTNIRHEVTQASFYSKVFDYISMHLTIKSPVPVITPPFLSLHAPANWKFPAFFGKSPEQALADKLAELSKRLKWNTFKSIGQVLKPINDVMSATKIGIHPYLNSLKAPVAGCSPTISHSSGQTYSRSSSGLSSTS